ncbi:MAG: hypothetical protein ACR2OU_20870 [Thermomicrobiales bacterium]
MIHSRNRNHHRLFARVIALAVLLFGLSPTFASPFVATAATSQASGDNGLTSDTTYESPQFGYAVAWDAPWKTRARNVTSNPGGFDALTLRDGSNNLRLTGRSGDDDPATVLDDSIALEMGSATDSEVISESTDSSPMTATLRVRTNIVLIEIVELPEDGALVVITLSTRSEDFDDVLATTQNVVALNDEPILSGASHGKTEGNVATPDVTEVSTTPEATEKTVPSKKVTPATRKTPIATEEATPEATAAVSGVDGSTYTSPQHGYTFSWDDSIWQLPSDGEISDPDQSYDSLLLEADTGRLFISGYEGYQGDATTCLEGESSYFETESKGVTDWAPATDANGAPLTDATGSEAAWGVYNFTYQNPDDASAQPLELTDYIECRTLVPGESVLVIFATATRDSYNDHIDNVQTVIDTIEIPANTSKKTANNSTPVTRGVTPEATKSTTKAPTPKAATSAGEIDGLQGSTFTSPSFGFVLDVPSDWTIQDGTIDPNDETLTLNNGVSTVTIHATDDPDSIVDLPSCVSAAADVATTDPAYTGLKIDHTSEGKIFQGSDDRTAYANYTYTVDGTKYAHFIECQYIAEGESVLVLSQDVPYDQYTTERGARREIENSIIMP